MRAILCITDVEVGDEERQELARDLVRVLNRETDITAALPEAAPAPLGSRGDPVTIGTIALTFLTGGSAVALIKVLETYLKSLSIHAENLRTDQIEQTEELTRQFFQE
ncbi:MAG: hypothetical protein NTW28_34590 [Candidatus Solibacter sp.]|nr:hypothetical protein [Candidatus Solibacter sp.]